MKSVVIVGAGLSGLAAGRRLNDSGLDFVVLDKGRGVGGRCATRRFQNRRFDHGAQFFTVRDPWFAQLVTHWVDSGLVREWSRGFPRDDGLAVDVGHPRYCAVNGMNTIPKALAAGLPVQTNSEVVGVVRARGAWSVRTEAGTAIRAETLVLSAPLPQTMALLSERARADLSEQYPSLRDVHYETCLAVLLVLDDCSGIPNPGGLHVEGPSIAWIADNTAKGLDSGASALTIHTTPGFAEDQAESRPEDIVPEVIAAIRKWLGGNVTHWQVHRWRYSKPLSFVGVPCVAIGDPPNLVLCGDCMQPPSRLEGAALSGMAAAEVLLR
jgi:predicted NAD/FAD-dependent oxidoreductase